MPGPTCVDSIATIPSSGSQTPLSLIWKADPDLCPDFFDQCVTQWNGGPTTGRVEIQGSGGPGGIVEFPISGLVEEYTIVANFPVQTLTDGYFLFSMPDIPAGPVCSKLVNFTSYDITPAALTLQEQTNQGLIQAGSVVVDNFYDNLPDIVEFVGTVLIVTWFMLWLLRRFTAWTREKIGR